MHGTATTTMYCNGLFQSEQQVIHVHCIKEDVRSNNCFSFLSKIKISHIAKPLVYRAFTHTMILKDKNEVDYNQIIQYT